MGDLRNKHFKEWHDEQERLARSRSGGGASGPPFVPVCAGCGLTGLNNPSPKGFGFLRMYAASGEWHQPGKFYCENCLEAHTGEAPHGW
jgi:hypothetical protein